MTDDRNDGAPMTEARLHEIIASYGSSPQRWPADERVPALALLARSELAQAHYDTAVRLDADLALLRPPNPSDALKARIAGLALDDADGQTAAARQRPNPWRPAAVAASLLVAFALGLMLPSPLRDAAVTPQSVAADDPPASESAETSDLATLADLALIDVADTAAAPVLVTDQLAAIPLE